MENEVRMKKSKLKKILGFSGVVILIIATFIFFYLKTNSYHPTSEALKISQKAEVQKNLEKIETVIPEDFDYDSAKGLSFEITQKLKKIKPRTLGEALNISGVTPAAISILLVYLKRYRGTKE